MPQLQIPTPCPANWAAMTPTAAGRHCASCRKTVVDFSQQTVAEILAYLAQPGQGTTCGRFRTGQLQPRVRLLTWRAAPRLALSIAAVLLLTHCTPDPTPRPPGAQSVDQAPAQPVSGRVLDLDTKEPVAGALIICEADSTYQTRAAADGSFHLALPAQLRGSKLIALLPYADDPAQRQTDFLLGYLPHYFDPGAAAQVYLRRPPPMLGQPRRDSAERLSPLGQQLTRKYELQPRISTVRFTPPPPGPGVVRFTHPDPASATE